MVHRYGQPMSMVTITEIMRIAELRDELITVGQLRKLRLSPHAVYRLVKSGVLSPVVRGVFSVVPGPVSDERRLLATCLSVPGGVVSHQSAAAHWHIRRAPRGSLDLTVRAPRQVRLSGIRVHRVLSLDEEDVVFYPNGLRVTTPARTLFDLAAIASPEVLASAAQDALNRRLCSPWSLVEVGERMMHQGRPGTAVFRELIRSESATVPAVGSDAELVLAIALEASGMPRLTRQFEVSLADAMPVRVDLAVPGDRFGIEVDDPEWHATPVAHQRDRARDLLLRVEGWDIIRVTTEDVYRRTRSTSGHVAALYFRLHPRPSLCA
jgi:very-short-patch-repair endonuclease